MRQEFADIVMILITSNGSASKRYYQKIAELVESISFSTHSEFMNEQEFFDKALYINSIMPRPKKSFHLNIMNEHWNQDRIEIYKNWCVKNRISHSVNEIDYSKQTRTFWLNKGQANLDN
jgi:hypothetical protein